MAVCYHIDINHLVKLLRSKGKDITASLMYESCFYKLIVKGKDCGFWESIGLLSVLSQYSQKTYADY
jgi:hypothetical protein